MRFLKLYRRLPAFFCEVTLHLSAIQDLSNNVLRFLYSIRPQFRISQEISNVNVREILHQAMQSQQIRSLQQQKINRKI